MNRFVIFSIRILGDLLFGLVDAISSFTQWVDKQYEANSFVRIVLFPLRVLTILLSDTLLAKPFGIPLIATSSFKIFLASLCGMAWCIDGSVAAAAAVFLLITMAYAGVICHEYGHALTARAFGYKAIHITIWPFAGLASLEGDR